MPHIHTSRTASPGNSSVSRVRQTCAPGWASHQLCDFEQTAAPGSSISSSLNGKSSLPWKTLVTSQAQSLGSEMPAGDLHGGQGSTSGGTGSLSSPSPTRLCCATGVATRLSRRRVSCRELGRPDCDGWLLLRKVASGFMGPRWRRCWFVLKGHTLYWYHQPQVRAIHTCREASESEPWFSS